MGEYQDFDGNPCSLHSLCVAEPEWAVNHIERLTTENAKLLAVVAAARRVMDYPDIRTYMGTIVSGYMDEALAALEGQEQDDG